MNNNLIAIIAATTIATSASALVDMSGTYESTFTAGNPGAASYAQDLDLKIVGSVNETKVTILMEDLTGGSVITGNQVFIETKTKGLNFKGGNFKNQYGTGLLQAKSPVANQMQLGFDIAGIGVTLGQVSGDSQASVNTSTKYAGVNIKVQNASNSNRFITASTKLANVNVIMESHTSLVGTNTAIAASTTQNGLGVIGVWIDVKDKNGITQNDGIIGDIKSNAKNDTIIKAAIVTYGALTGKYIVQDNLTTYVAKITRGNIEYGYTKADNADAVLDATIRVSF